MFLIIGLGNPGKKFAHSKHNVGFAVLDELSAKWHENKKFESLVSEIDIHGEKVLLQKPLTFMNDSGRAVLKIKKYYKIPLKNILVIHDDADQKISNFKLGQNQRSAGHKGVESIIKYLRSKNFARLKIGIQPIKTRIPAKEYVLKKFTLSETKAINNVIKKAAQAAAYFVETDIAKTMNKFN